MLQIPKEKLRRIVKSMKKAGNKMTEYCSDNNEEVVTALEFRNFMKAFVQV